MDVNKLTELAERSTPLIVQYLAQIANGTARIADHLTGSEQREANRNKVVAISVSEKIVNTENTTGSIASIDNFLATVTLEEINNTVLPRSNFEVIKTGGKQNFDASLVNMSIEEILAKERKDIVIKRSDRDMCLGNSGLKHLLCKIVQSYLNQQKDLDTKGSEAENLTKLLLNSTLVKSFDFAPKDINLIHKQTLERMQE